MKKKAEIHRDSYRGTTTRLAYTGAPCRGWLQRVHSCIYNQALEGDGSWRTGLQANHQVTVRGCRAKQQMDLDQEEGLQLGCKRSLRSVPNHPSTVWRRVPQTIPLQSGAAIWVRLEWLAFGVRRGS